ncbi:UNKNOWN [Stylonychia lemnae]|uniref:Uncharacterized protein n=1 Tax=Stylonychia lemnae TaxID=5949 RepID=A0A077ZWC7_STYLE|nr:UNKNOWN [Stylonychia lemnae]|eukprot:CDW74174.1 UNKNOWN [Stylonychia lemnae]
MLLEYLDNIQSVIFKIDINPLGFTYFDQIEDIQECLINQGDLNLIKVNSGDEISATLKLIMLTEYLPEEDQKEQLIKLVLIVKNLLYADQYNWLLKELKISKSLIRFQECKDLPFFVTKISYKDLLRRKKINQANQFVNSLVILDTDTSLNYENRNMRVLSANRQSKKLNNTEDYKYGNISYFNQGIMEDVQFQIDIKDEELMVEKYRINSLQSGGCILATEHLSPRQFSSFLPLTQNGLSPKDSMKISLISKKSSNRPKQLQGMNDVVKQKRVDLMYNKQVHKSCCGSGENKCLIF